MPNPNAYSLFPSAKNVLSFLVHPIEIAMNQQPSILIIDDDPAHLHI
jgi:hypothetical protein